MNFEVFLDEHEPISYAGEKGDELNGYNKFTDEDLQVMEDNKDKNFNTLFKLLGHKHDMERIQILYYDYFPADIDPLDQNN
jgi:hypothetical protein